MQGYNLIVVFSPDREKMLMCRRIKEPYKGLINFVGGKIEPARAAVTPPTANYSRKREYQTGI